MSNKKFRIPLILVFFTVTHQSVPSQLRETVYEPGDWITYHNTRIITSVSEGNYYIYFGTTNGIIRYHKFGDGWGYPLNTSNGLENNLILALAFDEQSNLLWAATPSGLSSLEPNSERFTNINKSQLNIPEADRITSIGIREEGIWLESGVGFTLVNRFSGFYKARSLMPPDDIEWFGLRSKPISKDLNFIMGGGNLFLSDGDFGRIVDSEFREYEITTALIDKMGNYWSGTCGIGPLFGDPFILTLEQVNYGILSNYVTAVALDDDLNLWVGGARNFGPPLPYLSYGFSVCEPQFGITKWDQVDDEWYYYQTIPSNHFNSDWITDIETTEDAIWFGTRAGVVYNDRETGKWGDITTFGGLKDEEINDMAIFGPDLWVGTDLGVETINLVTKETVSPPVLGDLRMKVYSLMPDGDVLWIGTGRGAYKIDRSKKTVAHYNGHGNLVDLDLRGGGTVTAFASTRDFIWMAGENGIIRLNKETEEWEPLPFHLIFNRRLVRKMMAGKKYLWVATAEGMLRYNRERKTWRLFTTRDGLADNSVNSFIVDEDYLWIGTDNGLTQFYWNDPYRSDG